MKKESFFKNIEKNIEKYEIKKRSFLSRHKIFYAIVGGTGVVLYWRGVWHFADLLETKNSFLGIIFSPAGSIIIGILILIYTGILVQQFIGNDIILSGIKKEKTDIEKTEEELIKEEKEIKREHDLIREIDKHLHNIEENTKK